MKWLSKSYGIPDELFIRDKVPMTKSSIRSVTLSKMLLYSTSKVLDIGCGTGSVSVECAILCSEGHITAIDDDPLAVELTQKNSELFEVNNMSILQGSAPQDLPDIMFDRIFLGGGSKHIESIVTYCAKHLIDNGIIVANTILIDSTYKVLQALEINGFIDIECIQVAVSKSEYSGHMLLAHNPIFIISARKRKEMQP